MLLVAIALILGGAYLAVGSMMAFDLMASEFRRASRMLLADRTKEFDAWLATIHRRIFRRWLLWPGYAISRARGRADKD